MLTKHVLIKIVLRHLLKSCVFSENTHLKATTLDLLRDKNT